MQRVFSVATPFFHSETLCMVFKSKCVFKVLRIHFGPQERID